MKRLLFVLAMGLALATGGCISLSAEDRAAIIEVATKKAGEDAAKVAEGYALKLGLHVDAAKAIGVEARQKAEEAAKKLATAATDKVAEAKGSTAGKIGMTILSVIAQLVLGVSLKPKEG